MTGLTTATLRRFLKLAGERLTGDWVIIGGCVLPLLGIEHRVTVDLDVAGPDEADMRQSLVLMEIAEELGLTAEAINQAGAHFLRLVDDWRDHLVEVHRGTGATLHVPDATLFLLLKLRRLTESDLSDCRVMLERARTRGEPVDAVRLRAAVRGYLRGSALPGTPCSTRGGPRDAPGRRLTGGRTPGPRGPYGSRTPGRGARAGGTPSPAPPPFPQSPPSRPPPGGGGRVAP